MAGIEKIYIRVHIWSNTGFYYLGVFPIRELRRKIGKFSFLSIIFALAIYWAFNGEMVVGMILAILGGRYAGSD